MHFFIHVFLLICGVVFWSFDLKATSSFDENEMIKKIALEQVLKTDAELTKARKLAEFVATHFERDGFFEKERLKASKNNRVYEKPYKNNILKTKVGDSVDFAKLYQSLCQAVGLTVVVIEGYAGRNIQSYNVIRSDQKAIKQAFEMVTGKMDSSLERYHNAWNAVQVNKKWILVDTYWMINGEKRAHKSVSSVRQMERVLAQSEKKKLKRTNGAIDKKYFNAKPKEMIKTHFPYDEKWQLLSRPISFNEFVKN